MSAAVTGPAVFLLSLSHSTPVSLFSSISHLRFSMMSTILSFTHGRVEYSCDAPDTLTPVTFVPGIEERSTRRNGFPSVTPYPFGSGPMWNVDVTSSVLSFSIIFGIPIVL